MRLKARGAKREPVLGRGCACCDRLPRGMSALGVRRDKVALFPVGASPTRRPFQPGRDSLARRRAESDYRHHGAAARACGERPCRRRTPAISVMKSRRCMSAPKLRRGFLSCSNERFDKGRGLNQVQYVLKRHRVLLLLPSVSSQSTSEAVSNQEAAANLR